MKENMQELIKSIILVSIIVIICNYISKNIVTFGIVPTGSMEETIKEKSIILINYKAYSNKEPKRGDIVVFHFPDDESRVYTKRIVSLTNEEIKGYNKEVYINDIKLEGEEEYIKNKLENNFGPYNIPENSYFMMGDNRLNSADSRVWSNKFVKKEKIMGKVVLSLHL